ncbi:MAG TPA: hypothetical protein VFB96_03705 [Pirellulaceae bacterium]|nr:hypothetical protein [Pirellulaceae bacterium]
MKWLLAVTLCLASSVLAASAWGAENPTGVWKWTVERNGQTREASVTLFLDGDKLSGHVPGRNNTVTPIEDASYKDGEIAFSVTRERNGVKFTTKYSGKVTTDTINGKMEFERDGKKESRDWVAKKSP